MSEHKHGHYTRTTHLSKIQQLAADIKAGRVKYLHVSVQVQAPTKLTPAMRTPRGSGSTARYPNGRQRPVRIGKHRRQQQRLMRSAYAELARAAV